MRKVVLIVLTVFLTVGCDALKSTTGPSKQSVITSFVADLTNLTVGQSTTLRWDAQGSTVCRLDPSIGNVPTTGWLAVSPVVTTTYNLTCSADGQNPSVRTVIINVK